MKRYNIYHRRDGRWEGRISRGSLREGKRKFHYIFAKTKEEVKKKIDAFHACELASAPCLLSISQIFHEWFNSIQYKVKESTAANYMMKAQKHILPIFGEKLAGALSSEEMNCFIRKKQSEGLSNRYISDILVLMKSIFKYAVRVYHIKNPMEEISMPKKRKPEINILDGDEQNQLQQYIAENQNHTTMGVALSMATGIRIGELCALQWKDIDLEKRILTVKKTIQRIQCPTDTAKTKLLITAPKSESSVRTIPLPECIISMLKKFKGKEQEYVLSGNVKPLEPRTMQYRFSKILKNVKLPSIHFHALRHMFASNCVKLGFDVKALSEILGHSSVEITLNKYVHSSFEQKREYMKRILMEV